MSPDAAIYARLIGVPPPADAAALALRLASAVQEVTALLREASAAMRAGPNTAAARRIPALLVQAEVAVAEQARCTRELVAALAA